VVLLQLILKKPIQRKIKLPLTIDPTMRKKLQIQEVQAV